MTPLFSPKEDLVFKLLFGDERHIDLLSGFLKAVLPLPGDDLAEISLISPTLPAEFPADKVGILDVQVRTRSGRLIDVEIVRREVAQIIVSQWGLSPKEEPDVPSSVAYRHMQDW
jgi:hypothetical protein